jgi:hypothetical protein
MSSLQSFAVPPELSTQDLERVIQQQEEIIGPLVSIGNDNISTLVTFDVDQDPPTNPALLRPLRPGSHDIIPGAALISTGVCFVNGQLQEIRAYRHYR